MKFTVKRAEMLKAVKTALKAVGGLEEISVTKDLLIEANSGNGIVSVADVIVVIKAVLNDTPLENGDLNPSRCIWLK